MKVRMERNAFPNNILFFFMFKVRIKYINLFYKISKS